MSLSSLCSVASVAMTGMQPLEEAELERQHGVAMQALFRRAASDLVEDGWHRLNGDPRCDETIPS